LLELKGKLADALPSATFAVEDSQHDILNALLALGYNDREASAAMKQLPAGLSTSDGIRQALKLLSKV
jgi:Holliday junction DNA helicase RuvA